ncbi:hypothetical protein GPJ56_003949 [Histomonas meleagridis]|uniref:uncharacterized protein n=1 Tax=Histomonas meleagridis TaxID=135588 RepID=UPI00355ACAB2|nr:hypothetical protein GPJ56_003949 [Histomonas meleagridis]KAH0798116.1 hypothetical protein GO595_009127 [Histomonas meleagridis]
MPEEIEAPQQHEAAPPAPPTPSTETQNDSQQPTETTQNQQQEPVQTRRQRMATHKENGFYQKETPVLYFPFGVQFNESPTPNEYEETYTAQDSTLPKVYPINIDCKVVECIVYNNGILWDGSFTPKSDPKCTKAIDQIEKNILPTDFVDDTQFVEVDIKFNSDESYEENPK